MIYLLYIIGVVVGSWLVLYVTGWLLDRRISRVKRSIESLKTVEVNNDYWDDGVFVTHCKACNEEVRLVKDALEGKRAYCGYCSIGKGK